MAECPSFEKSCSLSLYTICLFVPLFPIISVEGESSSEESDV